MRQSIQYKNKTIDLYVTNLCSYGEHGDYEFFPSEPLNLDLNFLLKQIKQKSWPLKGASEKMILFNFAGTEVTLFQSGRMILENVRPNSYQVALEVGRKIVMISCQTE